jgi:hypothetical protein
VVHSKVEHSNTPSVLWNPKVHYRVHTSASLVPLLSLINPIYASPSYFLNAHFIFSSHVSLGIPNGLLHSGFTTKTLHAHLFSPLHAPTLPAHVILLLIIRKLHFMQSTRSPTVQVRNCFEQFLTCIRWFKYDRDYLCVNKSQFVPVIFEPPCIRF